MKNGLKKIRRQMRGLVRRCSECGLYKPLQEIHKIKSSPIAYVCEGCMEDRFSKPPMQPVEEEN